MFDWSDTVFRRRNVTRRRISNTVLQPRDWGSEADSSEVCRNIPLNELEIEETSETASSVSFLDIYVKFGTNSQLSTRVYDKRDNFFAIINFPLL
jgi:hypothetical protein